MSIIYCDCGIINNVVCTVIITGKDYGIMTYISIAILCFCLGWAGAMVFYLFCLRRKHKSKFKKELNKSKKKTDLQEELDNCDK